jgi:histidine triad (HIT) family protein
MPPCDLCAEDVATHQLSLSDGPAMLIYPKAPVIDLHFMIAPIQHRDRFADTSDAELAAMTRLLRRVYRSAELHLGATGFNLFTNDGESAGQTTPHLQWHVFLRSADEAESPYRRLNAGQRLAVTASVWSALRDRFRTLFAVNPRR